ncbi:MAG: patatin-like phospholipase family protein [Xanthomonadales bacterium]|nr:patatin-like phospholipase family protein [Xanthomonadales bacterium]
MKVVRIPVVVLCLLLAGCASVVRNPVPEADHRSVTVLDNPDVRQWGDGSGSTPLSAIKDQAEWEKKFGGVMHTEHNYLVISGGGPRGAYGAGVLTAWTKLGTRPEFTIVTGVSTGALTAPFAFLGSKYDEQLKTVYTTLDTRQIINTRNFFAILGGDSVVDTSPLKNLIEKLIDDELISDLAREYRRGRALIVGTTNLDAGRPVVWNLTRMAASDHPEAAKLIRQVLLASASIPGAFPPVYIEVESPDGTKYDEMHVDGGVSSQMFFYPVRMDFQEVMEILDVRGTPTIYIIRNAFLHPEYKTISPRLLPIAGRTIDSLIRTQGLGDFFRIATLAERDGLDLNVTWIPEGTNEQLEVTPTEEFDPRYMKALFEYGHQRTLNGETWSDFFQLLKGEEK